MDLCWVIFLFRDHWGSSHHIAHWQNGGGPQQEERTSQPHRGCHFGDPSPPPRPLLVLLQMYLLPWKDLISDPNNHKKLPQTVASFFYDSENGNWNFTSVIRGVRPCSLEILPFNIDNGAISDCRNFLILCWCLRADGYRYVICNPATQKLKVLPTRIHSIGEARLGFNPIASSHFHVFHSISTANIIEYHPECPIMCRQSLRNTLGCL